MSKHHHKTHPTNRVANSVPPMESVAQETFVPSYEEIQLRAYQIHLQKGGSDLENWLEAERLLKQEHR